ncbi:MAG: hypothetical protein ACR2NS_09065 [Gemmatimonadaceae bacterium]
MLAAALLVSVPSPATTQQAAVSVVQPASRSLGTQDLRAGFPAGVGGFAAARILETSSSNAHTRVAAQASGGTPRWVKWGLVGAAAGAVVFSIAGQSNAAGNRSVASDAIAGAAIGFVILGGGIALYDSVCSPDSGSPRAGLCGG